MNALTFESINISPRRAAVRRSHRPALHVVAVEKQPSVIAATRSESDLIESRHKFELIVAIAVAIALHATVIYNIRNAPLEESVTQPQRPPLVIEMAPPPKKEAPPPPIVQPKPLPRVVKSVTPIKKAAPQPLSVAPNNTPMETTASPDAVQVTTAPVTAPPPPAPVEAVTEPHGYAGYLNNPAPTYPVAAQKRGLQGQVLLKVHVLASGKADDVSVAKSSGYSLLDEAAVKAVTAWMFEPAKRGKTPIDGWVQVPLSFKL